MKKIATIILACFLLPGQYIWGQDDCAAYTHTDPNPLYVQPTASGFKTNTFDWTGTNNTTHTIAINKPTPVTGLTIFSPFYQTSDL